MNVHRVDARPVDARSDDARVPAIAIDDGSAAMLVDFVDPDGRPLFQMSLKSPRT
ncbi:MAG: hypothetical protein M3Y87_32435 [Myxococcota bacterium]|nr:hypothetical protein [Myxococcota bacterium]